MSARPRLLDLFGGQGGAGEGYRRAGFRVYAVENHKGRAATYHPGPVWVGDALEALTILIAGGRLTFSNGETLGLDDFDAIHASPPCTGYSRGTAALPDRLERYDRLIAATRDLLEQTGKPYVIENVEDAGSELRNPMMLCWSMFYAPGSVTDDDGTPLRMERHRLFESNVPLMPPAGCNHPKHVQVAGAYGGARRDKWEAKHVRKGGYVPPSLDVLRALLDTPWMNEQGCFLSIPPAYTEHIGQALLENVAVAA